MFGAQNGQGMYANGPGGAPLPMGETRQELNMLNVGPPPPPGPSGMLPMGPTELNMPPPPMGAGSGNMPGMAPVWNGPPLFETTMTSEGGNKYEGQVFEYAMTGKLVR